MARLDTTVHPGPTSVSDGIARCLPASSRYSGPGQMSMATEGGGTV